MRRSESASNSNFKGRRFRYWAILAFGSVALAVVGAAVVFWPDGLWPRSGLPFATTPTPPSAGATGPAATSGARQEPAAVSRAAVTASGAAVSNDDIRKRLAQTQRDLRSIRLALEAYRADCGTYPDSLLPLLQPTPYLREFPDDPFVVGYSEYAKADPKQPAPHPGADYLKMAFAPDWSAIVLYSVGPDGRDQRGAAAYEPVKGIRSGGDVVERLPLDDYCRFEDPGVRIKVEQQLIEMNAIRAALANWYREHKALPERLEQIVSGRNLLTAVPRDLFARQRPLGYRLDAATSTGVVYSCGPDGDDDGGVRKIRGQFGPGEIPDGDIVAVVRIRDLQAAESVASDLSRYRDDPLMAALLALKERDHRDNALIHYAAATKIVRSVPDAAQNSLIQETLKQGWSNRAAPLVPVLLSLQPALEEVRCGAALDYAVGIGSSQGFRTPVPEFLKLQTLCKMLCVEGLYLENAGKPDVALDSYLVALTMGRDLMAPGGMLISHLVGIAAENMATNRIHDLVASRRLERPALDRVLARLNAILETQPTLADGLRGEEAALRQQLSEVRENPNKAREDWRSVANDFSALRITFEDLTAQIGRLEAEHKKLWDLQMKFARMPYWQRNPADCQRETEALLATMHPLFRKATANLLEPRVRFELARTKLLLTQLATALEARRLDTGNYPPQLSALAPKYLDALPLDPFSGHDFRYALAPQGESYTLYSVGPDQQDDNGNVLYDSAHGTMSGGDVYFEPAPGAVAAHAP